MMENEGNIVALLHSYKVRDKPDIELSLCNILTSLPR